MAAVLLGSLLPSSRVAPSNGLRLDGLDAVQADPAEQNIQENSFSRILDPNFDAT